MRWPSGPEQAVWRRAEVAGRTRWRRAGTGLRGAWRLRLDGGGRSGDADRRGQRSIGGERAAAPSGVCADNRRSRTPAAWRRRRSVGQRVRREREPGRGTLAGGVRRGRRGGGVTDKEGRHDAARWRIPGRRLRAARSLVGRGSPWGGVSWWPAASSIRRPTQ